MAKRVLYINEVDMWSLKEEREETPRHERCARCFIDVFSDEAHERGESDPEFEGVIRCYDTPHSGGLGDAYERDDWDEILPDACEGCGEFIQSGMPLPVTLDDILVQSPEIEKPLGHEIGELVAVRPCNPEFGEKTYLGILAGEMPVRTGLRYDSERNELLIHTAFSNPLIIIPEKSAAVYGYESWWHKIESEDELRDITDDDIMSQPYMAALAKLVQDS